MSLKGDIFLALCDHLKAKVVFPGPPDPVEGEEPEPFIQIPDLVWVDKYHGQIRQMDLFHAFPLPAIFIEFGASRWNSLSRNVQDSITVIRFYILFENYADSFEGSINQDMALAFLEFNEKVYKALQGWSMEGVTPLIRVADEEDNDHNNVIVSVMEFECSIADNVAETGADNTLVTEVVPKPLFVKAPIAENQPPEGSGYIFDS